MSKPKPVGKLAVIGAVAEREPNKVAVYAKVICEDEEGKKWAVSVSSFYFDLEPYTPTEDPHGD